MEIMKFKFNETEVEFLPSSENVMVNATQMAKIFGKKVENFTRIDDTKDFINECLKNANKRFLGIENEEDLIDSKQKSGTWMHRILALKFAAWLDPAFELWVYTTIDFILFGQYKKMEESIKQSAKRRVEIDKLRNDLRNDNRYIQLEKLELEEKQSSYKRGVEIKGQMELFKDFFFDEDRSKLSAK